MSMVLSQLSSVLHGGDEASTLLRDALRDSEERAEDLKRSLVDSSVALIASRRDLTAAHARIEDLEHAYAGSLAAGAAAVAVGSSRALREALLLGGDGADVAADVSSQRRRGGACSRACAAAHAASSALGLGAGAAVLAVAAAQLVERGGPLSLRARAAVAAVTRACVRDLAAPECSPALSALFSHIAPWLLAGAALVVLAYRARRKPPIAFAPALAAVLGAMLGIFFFFSGCRSVMVARCTRRSRLRRGSPRFAGLSAACANH